MPEKTRGYFDLKWSTIEISGPDALDFLNRMSTLDFRGWNETVTRLGAFLTGKSGVVSLGFFQSENGAVHYLVPPNLRDLTLAHIEQFHFAENMQVRDVSADWAVYGLWNERIEQLRGVKSRTWEDPVRGSLNWAKIARNDESGLTAFFRERNIPLLPNEWFEFYRMEAGIPVVGKDIDSSVLLLEADLADAVDRNKGCYPGQEVVERIFTYGQVNRKLLPVKLEGEWDKVDLPLRFSRDGKPAGLLVARAACPDDRSRVVGLAFIYRQFWETKQAFEESGVRIEIRPRERH